MDETDASEAGRSGRNISGRSRRAGTPIVITCGRLIIMRAQSLWLVPDWLISGGESGGGARPLEPQWIRDIIADCRRKGVARFHKQWGTYSSNPLVVEQGMSIAEAKSADPFGKGGGLVDGEIVREFPTPRRYERRNAA
jgi:hypothetical protein